ncbi:S8 family serine peptidase [Peptostreptococcus porci]|uniref:S8 family serine peptidase n=1 Tax=Peptostreptococcus porci TaxID=2652282 RepID=UPI002A7F135D|nr:S8 family serine peptidase [Peptostreptococcus porci]MDY4129017.1 S8 family serine peptidase [Peptostreptococcus porci]
MEEYKNNKIKVAVIDTGIDITDKDLNGRYKILEEIQVNDIKDINGHGTNVCKTIDMLSNSVEIYPINIFESTGRTSSSKLLLALEQLKNTDIKIINISASTINNSKIRELNNICRRLAEMNKIIVSAKHKYHDLKKISIPAVFDSVIGVNGSSKINNDYDFFYDENIKIEMETNGNERIVSGIRGLTHFGKSSRATAVASAIISNIIAKEGDLSCKELRLYLAKISKNKENICEKNKLTSIVDIGSKSYFMGDYSKCYRYYEYICLPSDIEEMYIETVIRIINGYFSSKNINYEFVRKYSLMNNFTGIDNYSLFVFLEKINRTFNVEIDYTLFFLDEVIDITKLIKIVYYYKKCVNAFKV